MLKLGPNKGRFSHRHCVGRPGLWVAAEISIRHPLSHVCVWMQALRNLPCENETRHFFWSFSCFCPEPVFANFRVLVLQLLKRRGKKTSSFLF